MASRRISVSTLVEASNQLGLGSSVDAVTNFILGASCIEVGDQESLQTEEL